MQKNNLDIIISNTYTIESLHFRMSLLKEFLEDFFFSEKENNETRMERFKKFLEVQDVDEHTFKDLSSLQEDFLESFTPENMYKIIEEILKEADRLPLVVLHVPVSLPFENIKGIGEWLRENVRENIMLRLKVDYNSVGGCAIAFQGKYYDFSLRYFMREKRKDIFKLIQEGHANA